MKTIQRKININEMILLEDKENRSTLLKVVGWILKTQGVLGAYAAGILAKDAYMTKKFGSGFEGKYRASPGSNVVGVIAALGFFGLTYFLVEKLQDFLEEKGMSKQKAKSKAKNIVAKKLQSELSNCKNAPDPEKCKAKIERALRKLKSKE